MKDPDSENNKGPKSKGAGPTRSFDGSVVGPGSQIGPFRIEQELGRGGAGVNHPNIATIYEEFEEVEGVGYLILEYVPGQTLAERIAKKPLKLEEALTIALQIAEAVAAAHEHDVIHRDLKPGNIKITQEGKVKVLDFGLAKVVGGEATDQQTTITEPGRVIGTPAYMSPEQARGKPTDKRSDIWAFGCILYEMLTAKVPFKGETISDTLAAILEHEPDWQELPESTPANIQHLLRHCLDKEPRRRLHDISDIAITIEDTTADLQRSTLPTKYVKVGPAQLTKWWSRALPWPITSASMVVLVFLAFIIGLKLGQPSEKQSRKFISGAAIKPINSIVVLPFENLSGDPEQEYFVDGMTDALSAELGKIKALRVISRTSAMQYKDTDNSIPEIAKELGVDAVIEGSVLKAGNDVRVTAQLVDGRTDAHLWSDNYTGTLTNILALQSQVTLAIAKEIEAALTPEEERRIARTESINPKAYEAYLKGRFFMEKETEESMKMAAVYFQRAIDIEPNYAEACAELSVAYWVPSIWGYTRPHDSFPKAKKAASKAMVLDDTSPMAHIAFGWIALFYDWEWKTAKESFEQAIQLNPSLSDAHFGLAWYWVIALRFDEAIDSMQTAVKLDPLSPMLNARLADVYRHSGQFERALAQYKEALKLDSSHLVALLGLADDYFWLSMYAEAEESIEKAMDKVGRIPGLVCRLGRTYAKSDRKDEARKLLEELLETDRSKVVLPGSLASLYATLGETDEALKWLEKAYLEHSFEMVWLRQPYFWPDLRSDPRFDDLVDRMNFPEAPVSATAAKPIETAQAPIEKIAVLPHDRRVDYPAWENQGADSNLTDLSHAVQERLQTDARDRARPWSRCADRRFRDSRGQ
jgi:serine/threonine protein kinase/tetratricopeptide (TPR) repeat protein